MNKIKEGIAQVLQPDPASSEPHDSLGAAAADAGSKTRFLSDPHRSREQTLPLCGARSTARMMQTERRTASDEKDDPLMWHILREQNGPGEGASKALCAPSSAGAHKLRAADNKHNWRN